MFCCSSKEIKHIFFVKSMAKCYVFDAIFLAEKAKCYYFISRFVIPTCTQIHCRKKFKGWTVFKSWNIIPHGYNYYKMVVIDPC